MVDAHSGDGREWAPGRLDGARVLVVGASSGIGRALGLQLARRGAQVAFAARRTELVEAAAAQAGGGAIGVVCDVRDEESCSGAVRTAVAAFGGLDVVVYATAIDVLVRLEEADHSTWADTFATNVAGAARVAAAALAPLRAARGRLVLVSASSVDRPLPGMGVYASSKAALETLARAWHAEHPDLCVSTVRVGSALGTEVTARWDRDLLMELAPAWNDLGYTHDNGPGGPMDVEEAAGSILAVIESPICLREVTAVSDAAHPRGYA
jgi:NAD(P)-dependent dehydrogenase (short-subunit alcohol dehydrogenase family)